MVDRDPRTRATLIPDGDLPADRDHQERATDSRLILDWDDKADLLAWAIANDRTKLSDRWFKQHGYNSPDISWDFAEDDVADADALAVYRFWVSLLDGGSVPTYDRTLASISAIDGANASLLHAIEGGRDFRYSRFSTSVAALEGRDWTGSRLSEFAVQSYRGVFYLALYRVMLNRAVPCLIRHESDNPRHGAYFQRVLLPLCDDVGRISGFMNANSYQDPPQSE